MNRRLRSIFAQVKAHPYRVALAVLPLLVVAVVLVVPNFASASALENATLSLMNTIFSFFMFIFGNLLVLFTDVLIYVATYANITDVEAVKVGWAVVRDLANMGFIVAMLLISFGTIFRFQEYRYSRLLGKLVIMAILINFSRLIASLLVDFSQVIMLTFVNAFSDLAAGNITSGFGVEKIVAFSQNASALGGDINLLSVLGAMFAGIVMLFIATAIVASFVVFLVQRMIMLWIYIILSPLAYMMAVLPGSLGRFWGGWWETFMKYLIRGPVIGFYLWLAFTIASFTNTTFDSSSVTQSVDPLGTNSGVSTSSVAYFANQASTGASVLNYVVFAALLIAGLQQAAAAGGVAGKMAGKSMATFEKWGSNLSKAPWSAAKYVGARPAYGAATGALAGLSAAGNSKYLAWTGLGTTFGKMRAKVERKRLKSEDKDSDWINYADDATRKRLALAGPALTESGRRNQKIARERNVKNNDFKGYTSDEKRQVLESYRKDTGRKLVKDKATGDYRETFIDAAGGKMIKDLMKKSPDLLAYDWRKATGPSGSPAEAAFWKKQIEDNVNSMSVADFASMNGSAWSDPDFRSMGMPILENRIGTNANFMHRMKQDVPQSVRDDINAAYRTSRGLPAGAVLFRSDDGDSEDEKQDEKQSARRKIAESFIGDVSGLRKFVDQGSMSFGVDGGLLRQIAPGLDRKAGFIRDPATVQYVAGEIRDRLANDVSKIEQELVTASKDEEKLLQPSTVLGADGRPLTFGDTNPEQAEEIHARKKSLESELQLKRQAIEKFDEKDVVGNMQFYNRDKHVSLTDAKKSNAHENTHAAIEQLDPDGSLRKDILENSFTQPERAELRDVMAKRTKNRTISFEDALDEYLTEGLVNQGSYGDKKPGALQLKPGLDYILKRQAEAKDIPMRFVGESKPMSAEEQRATQEYTSAQAELAKARSASQQADAAVQNDPQTTLVQRRIAERDAEEAKWLAEAEASKRGGQTNQERRHRERAAQFANISDEQIIQEVAKNDLGLQQKVKAQQQAEINAQKAEKAAEVKAEALANARSVETEKKRTLQEELKQKVAKPKVVEDRVRPALPGVLFRDDDDVSAGGSPNITNNIRNEITQVVKSAPEGFRDTMKLTSSSLDNVLGSVLDKDLRKSLVVKSLMENIRKGFETMQTSAAAVSDETKSYFNKRIAKLDEHVDKNNVDGFRKDFGELQKEFESIIE